jgi:hypothetical protein
VALTELTNLLDNFGSLNQTKEIISLIGSNLFNLSLSNNTNSKTVNDSFILIDKTLNFPKQILSESHTESNSSSE